VNAAASLCVFFSRGVQYRLINASYQGKPDVTHTCPHVAVDPNRLPYQRPRCWADLKKRKGLRHHPALAYKEVAKFMTELHGNSFVSARALEFTILTAARTSEVINATWEEVDFDEKTWTIPAARMKANREHRVPLSERALKILAELPRKHDNPHCALVRVPRSASIAAASRSFLSRCCLLRRAGLHLFDPPPFRQVVAIVGNGAIRGWITSGAPNPTRSIVTANGLAIMGTTFQPTPHGTKL
jgi:integrase